MPDLAALARSTQVIKFPVRDETMTITKKSEFMRRSEWKRTGESWWRRTRMAGLVIEVTSLGDDWYQAIVDADQPSRRDFTPVRCGNPDEVMEYAWACFAPFLEARREGDDKQSARVDMDLTN